MKRITKVKNNNLDEMQELQLLHIERNGCWLAFWGLLAVMIVEIILDPAYFRHVAGEWIVFMCLALYMSISCIRHGIWDRRLRPNLRTNVFASAIAGLACGILFFAISYKNYGKLIGSLATGALIFIFVFVSTIVILTIFSKFYKQRVKKLESEDDSK